MNVNCSHGLNLVDDVRPPGAARIRQARAWRRHAHARPRSSRPANEPPTVAPRQVARPARTALRVRQAPPVTHGVSWHTPKLHHRPKPHSTSSRTACTGVQGNSGRIQAEFHSSCMELPGRTRPD